MQSLKAAICTLAWPAFAAACHQSAVACAPSDLGAANWPREYTSDSSISLQLPMAYKPDSPARAGHQVIWFWHTSARGAPPKAPRFDREVSLAVSERVNGSYVWPTEAEAKDERSSDPMWVDDGSSCNESIGGR